MKTMRRRTARVAGEVDDRLDQLLAFVVGRVGLAGEDELDRLVGVFEQLLKAIGVAQQQRAAFVGGEAAGEADGQRLGIEHLVGGCELVIGCAAANELLAQASAAPSRPGARGSARGRARALRRESA